jgi:hypothetical protein
VKYKTKFNYKRNEYYVYYDMDNDHVCIVYVSVHEGNAYVYYDMDNDHVCIVYVSVHEGNANNEADRLNGIERLNERTN